MYIICDTIEEVEALLKLKAQHASTIPASVREKFGEAQHASTIPAELARFLASVREKFGEAEHTAKQISEAVELEAVFGRLVNNLKLGKWLSANKGRMVNGMCIEDCGLNRTKSRLWKVNALRPFAGHADDVQAI